MAVDVRSDRPRYFESMGDEQPRGVLMRELKQHTTFLRESIVLPEGISFTGETFCEGWTLLESGDASWLDTAIRSAGWNSFVLTKSTGEVDSGLILRMPSRRQYGWLFAR